jgi:hypothetical protein
MLATIAITCWLCAGIATPHRARLGNEAEELVYVRLLGRQQRLVLLALLTTAATLFAVVATASQGAQAAGGAMAPRDGTCSQVAPVIATCPTAPAGTILVREIQDDGRSAVVATVAAPSGPHS